MTTTEHVSHDQQGHEQRPKGGAQPTTAEAQLAKSNASKAESLAAMKEREKWNPTPTQEENDLAALGNPQNAKKPDGSPVEKVPEQHTTRQMEANRKPGADYQTRSAG